MAKILIVDDNELFIDTCVHRIELSSSFVEYEIDAAKSTEEAIEKIKKN